MAKLRYVFDRMRHLICVPYSKENLHVMAEDLGIKRCWYHGRPHPHYDIPKRMFLTIHEKGVEQIDPRELLRIIQNQLDSDAGMA